MIESSVTIGEYFYDGDGKRVKKIAGSEETIFVYDAGGKLIGEYSTIVQTGNNAKTAYTTNDHLGSPRINTDGVGAVISRHDYHPFGEEIARTGYGSGTIRKQFTGYERDEETGLDFAEARMYSSFLGRYGSTDPILIAKVRLLDPQRLNLYAYVRNNPLVITDPTGLDLIFELERDGKTKKVTNFADANRYVKALEKASGVKLNLDKETGQISVKGSTSNLTKIGQKINSIIGDTNKTVTIAVSNNDSNVQGGKFDGNGRQTIDFADVDALTKGSDKKGGLTETSIVVHETVEAYEGLGNGNNFAASHSVASDYENEVRKSEGLGVRILNSEKLVSWDPANGQVTFSVDLTTHIQEVTVKTKANVPTGDILKSVVRKKP